MNIYEVRVSLVLRVLAGSTAHAQNVVRSLAEDCRNDMLALPQVDEAVSPVAIEATDLGKAVPCSLCGGQAPLKTAHLHQGEYIGDECCWDERLRSSE